jgi:amino-acid N-acetyltransferase
MEPQRAAATDWPAVRDLLVRVNLPLDGAETAFQHGLVAVEDDRIVGCAAIETFVGSALLRSVAVTPHRRGTGVGRSLVHAAEELARQAGADEMILLTETAEQWFRGLGYDRIDRATVQAEVAQSVEFVTACSEAAVAMRRPLNQSGRVSRSP